MERITSRTNALVAHIRKLNGSKKYRRSVGEMVCEGPKMLVEALKWGAEITVLIQQEGLPEPVGLPDGVRRACVPRELLAWLSDTETPQGMLFLCRIPETVLGKNLTGSKFLILDGLQDPGNVGTIWRTADAFGADGLFLLPGCADPWGSKTLRATMGACFRLPIWEISLDVLPAQLASAGIPLYAAALGEDALELGTVPLDRGAVVIGSEGRGVSQEILALCAKTLKIPMRPRCESLNAAVAASVVLWEMAREK